MNTLRLLGLFSLIMNTTLAYAAEPVISIDDNIININPQGNTSSDILQSLSQKIGFELVGKLETQPMIIDTTLTGNAQTIIEQLVKPQSVIVLFKTDEHGNKQVTQVELIPTGNADSQFLNDGKTVGFQQRKLTGDPEKDKFHMEKDQRRNERHAQGLGRINQPNFGIVTQEDVDREKELNGEISQ